MITIKPRYTFYDYIYLWRYDECIGAIETQEQFTDVRLQILKQGLEGYYVRLYSDGLYVRVNIDKNGELDKFPSGLFDRHTRMLDEMIKIRKERKAIGI